MDEPKFTGLTSAQKRLLTFQGWTVDEAHVRRQPSEATMRSLEKRGLAVVTPIRLRGMTVLECHVPIRVHMAWCSHCERIEKTKIRRVRPLPPPPSAEE